MKQNSFLNTIRAYRSLHIRKQISYAEAVNQILRDRFATIDQEIATEPERGNAKAAAADQARREYGAYDRDFETAPDLDIIPF